MTRQNVSSGSPYEPIIGFSRAVRIGNTIAVGGTAPIGPDGKTAGIGDPAAQTRRSIEIIKTAIEKAGGRLENVIRTRVFLTRQQDWEAVGRAHGEAFGAIRPASTMAVVKQLLNDEWLVEIEADAVIE
jgi:enamine deaminase RidA (YjgF/YER057c/UK114 family)